MKNSSYIVLLFLTISFLYGQSNFGIVDFHYSPNFIENKGQFDNPYFQTKGKILYAVDQNTIQIYFTDKAEVIYRIEKKIKNPNRQKGDISKPKKLALRDIIKSQWLEINPNFNVQVENPSSDYHNYAMLSSDRKEVYSINQIPCYGKLIYKNIYPNVDIIYEVKREGGVKYSLILNPGADISKISLQYDKEGLQLLEGQIIIPSTHGNLIETKPYSYLKNSKRVVESEFVLEGNKVKYSLKGLNIRETVVFDPWVQTPSLPNTNGVWEVETDALGNVYVIGGDMPMKLLKYSPGGILLWTYNTPYDTANYWLGTMATDQAGFTYVTSGSSANIQKINPSGGLVWNDSGGFNDEYWAISFSVDQSRLIVGGTRLNPLNIAASNGVVFDINTNNGSQITRVNVAGTRPGALGLVQEPNEVRSLTSSKNGRYYYLTLDSIGGFTKLFGSQANCPKSLIFQNNSTYNFAYKCETYRPDNGNAGIKAIVANDWFIYTHNGTLVHRRDLNNGAILGTFNIPGGINTSTTGFNQPGNNGIQVDSCGNVYVGSSDRIIKLDPFLNVLQTVTLPFRVFDIAIGINGEVVVCGATGDMNSASRTGYVQSVNMGACQPFPLVECDATICQVNPVCLNAAPFNFTAVTPGGTWSGPGITNPSTGTFNPSIAGTGNHWIKYTLPCGSDSIQIQVNSCATLTVCVEGNGQFTVSGGSGTYTWQQFVPAQNVTINNAATCTQCGGTWNAFANQCFNPFPIPITSCTVPASYQTYATGVTANPPSFYPIRIFTSNGDTVILNSAPTQSCCAPQPSAPTVNNPSICSGTTATLTATAPTGATFQWYDVASGGNPLFTGNPFITPNLTSNTTYYVEAVIAGCTSTRTTVTVTITNVNSPTVNNASICSGTTATLTATAPAGATFQWYDVASGGNPLFTGNPFVTPNLTSNTTYYVEAVIAGCTSTRTAITVTIQNITNPTVSDITICPNSTGTFTATAPIGATFDWYDQATSGNLLGTGSTFTTPVLTSTTTYYVEAIQGTCTSSRIAVTVNVSNNIPSPTVSDITICTNNSGTFTATAPIGVTFDWYDQATGGNLLGTGSTFTTPVLTSTTTYYVEAIQGTCTSSRIAVNANVITSLTDPVVSNATICENEIATLTVTSPASVQFDWYTLPNGGTILFIGNPFTTPALTSTTIYYVEAVAFGCTSNRVPVTVTVNPIPQNPIVNNATICEGENASLSATVPNGVQVNWYDSQSSGNLLSSNNPFVTPNLNQTTTYYVEAIQNGCTSNRSAVTVNVNSKPSVPILLSDTTICENQSATLIVSSLGTVSWYDSNGVFLQNGDTLITPTLFNPTTYFVETVLAGCTSNRISIQVIIQNITVPNRLDSLCIDSLAVLTVPVITGSQVNWYDKDGNFIQTNNSLTINSIQTDTLYYFEYVANGCTSNRASYTIKTYQNPIANFVTNPERNTPTDDENSTFTFINNSQNGVRYVWYFGDGDSLVTSSISPITHKYKIGEFDATLCVYNEINCVSCYQYGKLMVVDDFAVWIPNVFTPNGDGLNDKFEYVLRGIKSIEIEIYDRWGTSIYFADNMTTFWDGNKNGKPCPEGVYTYVIKMVRNNGKSIKRFGTITLLR